MTGGAQGIKRPELRDELYMQLLKQSRGNTTPSCAKVISSLEAHEVYGLACSSLARTLGVRAVKCWGAYTLLGLHSSVGAVPSHAEMLHHAYRRGSCSSWWPR